jgi:hypothetical protein
VAFKAGTICLIQNTGAIVQVKLEGRLISQSHISTSYTTLKPAPEPALKRSRDRRALVRIAPIGSLAVVVCQSYIPSFEIFHSIRRGNMVAALRAFGLV